MNSEVQLEIAVRVSPLAKGIERPGIAEHSLMPN